MQTQTSATVGIAGMTCGHCKQVVEQKLLSLRGVRDISVDLDTGSARVTFRSDEVTMQDILQAIEDEGYDVQLQS